MMKSSLFSIAFILLIDALSLVSAGSNEASKVWLAENAKKEGVTTLPSGLQYKVLTKGTGDSHPTIETPCLCHYEGTLIDGTVFDSTYDQNKPKSFIPHDVIDGWTEAMQLMVVGDKWEMYIPSNLAYGKAGSPPHIKAGDAVIFKFEIIEIEKDSAPTTLCDIFNTRTCNDDEKKYITTTEKGLGGYSDMIEAQIRMIQNWDGTESEENIAWGIRRINILKQLLLVAEDNEDL
mmetsp:Transcript_35498/g.42376  ORF Transcript_35498/g.42376 Transcript_35498/m.42376 type:complete len:234 (+) Transcript_35498:21-722(+)